MKEFRAWDNIGKKMWPNASPGFDPKQILVRDLVDMSQGRTAILIDFEIMQYIGMKDINGKKAFEGDFVRNIDCDVVLIEFYKGRIASGCDPFVEIAGAGWQCAREGQFEIIGNKFENPEKRILINE